MDDLFGVAELAKNMEIEEAEAATAREKPMEIRERGGDKVTEVREENVSVAGVRNDVG
jgi:hypothetical protein